MTIRVTTSSGTPLDDMVVVLNGGFDGRSGETDAAGNVRFAAVPAGEAQAAVWARGFHSASSWLVVTPDTDTDLALIMERVTEATPVVLGTHAVPAADGRSVTVDVDIAVLDESGLAIPTFTAAEFAVSGSDCAFAWCVTDVSGQPLPDGGYVANVDSAGFGWHESPVDPPPPLSAALLMEQGTAIADFDPAGLRLGAVNGYLESVSAPDTVSLASFRGVPPAPILTTYGPFTSDATQYRDDVDALAGREAGMNLVYEALADMLAHAATHAPSGPGDPPRRLVLVSSPWSWPDDACAAYWTCPHEQRLAVAAASEALGIPVVAIGGNEPVADIAARSGGLSVVLQDPEQYPVVLSRLSSIAGRNLGFNRVRVVLDAGAVYGPQANSVFRSGHTVWAYMSVRVGPSTNVYFPVVILIQ